MGACGVSEIPGTSGAEGLGPDASSWGNPAPHAEKTALQGQVMEAEGQTEKRNTKREVATEEKEKTDRDKDRNTE